MENVLTQTEWKQINNVGFLSIRWNKRYLNSDSKQFVKMASNLKGVNLSTEYEILQNTQEFQLI